MNKVFDLNKEEISMLETIAKLEAANKRTDFHSIFHEVNIDNSGKIIPVLNRLEDDGYIFSDGVIYRYYHMTPKGKEKINL